MKKEENICVIMLTYNREEYVERTIESLYKRAGKKFDLYLFDDNSNSSFFKKVNYLKNKYNFKIFKNSSTLGIYKNFFSNITKIKKEYDYYVKLDSDIEILSDNFFSSLLPVFKHPQNIAGITPRVEGILNSDRYVSNISFYGGHVIKVNAPIVYGCCFLFMKETFKTLHIPTAEELNKSVEKWGIDTLLYENALKNGLFCIVEDVSVYHIDNTYGQRRKNPYYFINRDRWSRADINEVWFMEASKYVYPKTIDKQTYLKIKKVSESFNDFKKKCKTYLKMKKNTEIDKEIEKDVKKEIEIKEDLRNNEISIYKIMSPANFTSNKNIPRGKYVYYTELPIWAKNNPRLVVEKEKIKEKDISDYINKEFFL